MQHTHSYLYINRWQLILWANISFYLPSLLNCDQVEWYAIWKVFLFYQNKVSLVLIYFKGIDMPVERGCQKLLCYVPTTNCVNFARQCIFPSPKQILAFLPHLAQYKQHIQCVYQRAIRFPTSRKTKISHQFPFFVFQFWKTT